MLQTFIRLFFCEVSYYKPRALWHQLLLILCKLISSTSLSHIHSVIKEWSILRKDLVIIKKMSNIVPGARRRIQKKDKSPVIKPGSLLMMYPHQKEFN